MSIIVAAPKYGTTPAEEAIIMSFNLTSVEWTEVEALALSLRCLSGRPDALQERELRIMASKTANAGAQYLLLGVANLVKFVISNDKLDSRVVPHFLKYSAPRGNAPLGIYASLFDHKLIVGDANLFKQVWETVQIMTYPSLSLSQEALDDLYNLSSTLEHNSTSLNSNAMSIETLLLILVHLNRSDQYEIRPALATLRARVLDIRGKEIEDWVSEHMPDLVGLPLSWVLEAYDLYGWPVMEKRNI